MSSSSPRRLTRASPTLEFKNISTDPPTKETIEIPRDRILKVGRDRKSNNKALNGYGVSRNHLEFFAVYFDDDDDDDDDHEPVQPMIYVRDRQSSNGTYVNNKRIGMGPDITAARLLEHGDVVTIRPNWSFTLKLPAIESAPLTDVQTLEVKLFDDRYRISKTVIGTGASTTVRVAYDVKSGQQLACKILDLSTIRHREEVEKIMCGLDLMAQLEHPNIASFKGAYKSKHTVYIFEELATGGDLWAMAARRRKFSELQVCWMIRQMLLAVDYLHKKGVVHRDIKMENVLAMVCPRPAHRLALTDFGHADLVGRPHDTVGTRGWQAPELFQEGAYYGFALDMWSIGIMAVRLLCGFHEVRALDALEDILPKDPHIESIDHAAIIREIDFIRSESATHQPLRDDFIKRCLETNQYKRMTAAEALAHPWVNESAEMQKLFNIRQEQNTKAWEPRKISHQPICELHDVLALEKLKKKIASDKTGFGTRSTEIAKESPYFKGSYKISKPADADEPKKDPEFGEPRLPKETFNTISPKEKARLFGMHGIYGRPSLLDKHLPIFHRANKDQREGEKKNLLEKLRENDLKFLPRRISWPRKEGTAKEEQGTRKTDSAQHKKRTSSSSLSGDEGAAKKRKVVLDPSDGKPIDFTDPWTPV